MGTESNSGAAIFGALITFRQTMMREDRGDSFEIALEGPAFDALAVFCEEAAANAHCEQGVVFFPIVGTACKRIKIYDGAIIAWRRA